MKNDCILTSHTKLLSQPRTIFLYPDISFPLKKKQYPFGPHSSAWFFFMLEKHFTENTIGSDINNMMITNDFK